MRRQAKSRLFGALVLLFLVPTVARADDTEDMCVAASLEGQVLERARKLGRARERYAQCVRPECEPAQTTRKCAEWLAAVTPKVPRLEMQVIDERGRDLPAAEILLDGERRVERNVAIDPGHHAVRASYAGVSATSEVDLGLGEVRAIRIALDLRRWVPERPLPTWVVATTGLTIAALGSFALFGSLHLAKARDLEACRPLCGPDERSALTTPALVADTSLAVGLVAAVVSCVGYFTRPTRLREERYSPRSMP